MKKTIAFLCIITFLLTLTTPVYAAKKDTKAPIITNTNPADYGTKVMTDGTILIRFNELIVKGKAIAKTRLLEDESKTTKFTYEIKDNYLTIIPKSDLKYNTMYSVIIPKAAISDKSGNSLAADYTFHFITETDPNELTEASASEEKTKYTIELEALMQNELTEEMLDYFLLVLKKMGIEAAVTDFYSAEDGMEDQEALEEDSTEEDSSEEDNSDEAADLSQYGSFDVRLDDAGDNSILVEKRLREILGVGISQAGDLVFQAPVIIIENISRDYAEQIEFQLEEAGATVTILGHEQ